jgi:LysM repeat protein
MSDVIGGDNPANAFTKKIGPLPGWVWVVGIAGIAWVIYLRKQKSTAVSAVTTAPVGADSVFPVTYGDAPGTGTFDGVQNAGPKGTSNTTNASWAKMVTDALITAGGNPTEVSNAITRWLSGESLNTTQQAIVNNVQRQYGTPPNGVLPVNVIDASADSGHTYTVQAGDTLSSIAQRFYGNASNSTGLQIINKTNAAANGLSWNPATNSYDVKVGQTLELYQDGLFGFQDNSLKWP